MATTQELLDKLKSNLTSIYDKLEQKGVQVEGNKNLDNLVLAIDNVGGGGGGGITEIYTTEEMEAFKSVANVGKYAKYVGETTDTYVNGAIYLAKQEGGNIAKFTEADNMEGSYIFTSNNVLPYEFIAGETIKVNFRIEEGGEVLSHNSQVVDLDGMKVVCLNDGVPELIYSSDKIGFMFMGYLNINAMTGEQGQAYMCMPMPMREVSTPEEIESLKVEENVGLLISWNGSPYIVKNVSGNIVIVPYEMNFEVVSFENSSGFIISNPIEYKFKPYFSLQTPAEPIATASEIKQGTQAYNEKGRIIDGTLQNPPYIENQAQFDNLYNTAKWGEVYHLNAGGTIKPYTNGGYVWCQTYNDNIALMPMFTLEDIINSSGIGNSAPILILNRYMSGIHKPYCFYQDGGIQTVIFENEGMVSISSHAFDSCYNLRNVVIYGQSVVNGNEAMFDNTPITNGDGYIYVQDSLVEDYKVAEYWSTYASQIKPLSEYVE